MRHSIAPIFSVGRAVALISLAAMVSAPTIQAQQQVILYQDTGNYSYGDGGEFNAVPSTDLLALNPTLAGYQAGITSSLTPYAGGANFQTFCLETSEYFTPGNTYNVSVSQTIQYNGGQFLPPGEPLTLGTAWLYSQFAAGTLAGYDYTQGSGRIASAGDLQQTIWYLQGEVGSLMNGSADGSADYAAALAALGGNIGTDSDGAFGVVAMNLTSSDGNDQDQLMITAQPAPEPGTMALGLLGLLSLGGYKARTFFNKRTA